MTLQFAAFPAIPVSRSAALRAILGAALLFLSLSALPGTTFAEEQEVQPSAAPDIEVFASKRCPHCTAAKLYLAELQRERPGLKIVIRDVDEDPAALARLRRLTAEFGYRATGVPAFYLRDELVVGFSGPATTGKRLRSLLNRPPPRGDLLPDGACLPTSDEPCDEQSQVTPTEKEGIETTVFGRLDPRRLGLPLFTVAVGLLDGLNPCAMWVLLFLLSLLVNLRDRRKMLIIAGTFVLISGLVYFAFMAAWLNVFLVIGYSRPLQLVLGGIALLVGAFNVKDFLASGKGPSLSIPESAKPGLYVRVRRILQAEDLAGALFGVIALAVLVNMVELLCTAGFPAMYTHILSLRDLSWWQYYGYLALYNVAYMFDDMVIVTIAVVTLGHRKLQEREGRWLKLISGLVMMGLGAVLLAKPEWLAL